MEPISNADRLVLILRQKLEERGKTGKRSKSDVVRTPVAQPADIRALAAIDWSDERPLRRTIVQHLLSDQFGSDLVNDAQFQQIVTRVTDAIESDEGAAALLTRVVSELRQT
jgi:hypothetical protein